MSTRPIVAINRKNNAIQEKLKREISAFQNLKLFTHKNPDGDAVGSVLALGLLLQASGKNVEMFAFDAIEDRFSFFPSFEKIKIVNKIEPFADNDLIFFIDCSDASRTGFEVKNFKGKKAVVVDHHPDKISDDPDVLKIIDAAASSTAEVIFELASKMQWKIDREISICLVSGIIADTGTFQHSNTSPKSLKIVSLLVKNGINLKKIADKLFQKRGFDGSLKIWGEILRKAALDPQTKMAFSYVSQEDLKKNRVTEDELSGLVNLLSGIPESRFSLLLVENKFGKIKGSLRSEAYKGVDVARIAQSFDGGGHKLAAGFEMEGKIEEKIEYIKKKIREELAKQ